MSNPRSAAPFIGPLLWAMLTQSATFAATAPTARPNVLFLAADDMRPQLGCYGDPIVKSPHLDALAGRGVLFERAYCQQALCSPSRISLLSGRHVWTTKITTIGPNLRSTMPDIVTLPQHFKNQGYHTRSLGKVYHIGIDDAASWSEPSWLSRAPRHGPVGRSLVQARQKALRESPVQDPDRAQDRPGYASPAFEAPDCADEDLTDGDLAREAVAALETLAKQSKPFFLAVGFVNPHVPWVAPKRYFDLYDPAQLPIPANSYVPREAPEFAAKSGQDFFWYGNVPRDRIITPDFGRKCLQGYFAAISYVDACVGSVLATLDRLGLRENTVVVFWSDHGYYMGEHGWWGAKHNNYEGATRAPLMIIDPRIKTAGGRTRALVEFVDIYPTLVELCGLPPAPGVEGRSLTPLLRDPSTPWPHTACSEYPIGGYYGTALRTERYRFVEWRDRQGSLAARELYDHQADPAENQNLGTRPEHAALLDQFSLQLAARQRGPGSP